MRLPSRRGIVVPRSTCTAALHPLSSPLARLQRLP
jgi:hypothetical protein